MRAPSLADDAHVVYLDNMGSALPRACDLNVGRDVAVDEPLGNPHSQHPYAYRAARSIAMLRRWVAAAFGAEEYDVVLTSSCTAGCAKVAACFPFSEGSCFAAHQWSHNSVLGIREVLKDPRRCLLFHRPSDISSWMESMQPSNTTSGADHLVCFPAECNFSGCRIAVAAMASQIARAVPSAYILVDAAAMAGKAPLSFDGTGVHYVVFSFYKMFGFPTGLGALLVRRGAAQQRLLQGKQYFGGGTVDFNLAGAPGSQKLRDEFCAAMEDGTANFQAIAHLAAVLERVCCYPTPAGCNAAVKAAIDGPSLWDPEVCMTQHAQLRERCVEGLKQLKHGNGTCVVRVLEYESTHAGEAELFHTSGSSVAFRVVDCEGQPVGHSLVEKVLLGHAIYVRSGCFCNPGACAYYLGFDGAIARRAEKLGKVCSDEMDVVDGVPTGAVRVSFGLTTSEADIARLITAVGAFAVRRHASLEPALLSSTGGRESETGSPLLHVSSIWVFPVKGLSGVSVPQWPIAQDRGLLWDREWMIIDAVLQEPLQAKRHPDMSSVAVSVDLRRNRLTLTSTVMCTKPPLHVSLCEETGSCSSSAEIAVVGIRPEDRCFRSTAAGGGDIVIRGKKRVQMLRYYAPEVDAWLSDVLRVRCRLVRRSPSAESLSNTSTLLVIHDSSHWHVVEEVASTESPQRVQLEAYRANLVLSGGGRSHLNVSDTGFVEHTWSRLRLRDASGGNGEIVLTSEGPCSRCSQVNVAHGRLNREPLASLSRICRGWGLQDVLFGQHFRVSTVTPDDGAVGNSTGMAGARQTSTLSIHCDLLGALRLRKKTAVALAGLALSWCLYCSSSLKGASLNGIAATGFMGCVGMSVLTLVSNTVHQRKDVALGVLDVMKCIEPNTKVVGVGVVVIADENG